MTREQMSVHKALAELKTIDSRIANAITSTVFVAANKHSNEKITGMTITEYKDMMKSGNQKVEDLIRRRNAMKRAVVLSNASTTVDVDGVTYTVAEAIDMKNNGIDHLKNKLREMTYQYRTAKAKIDENSGEAIEKRAENYVLSVIQSQPKDSKMAIDSDAMKALRKDYIANNTYDLIDPLGILKDMERVTDNISKFEAEVDAALSVSNALTIIEFEY